MREVLRRPDFRILFAGLVASMTAESILLLALAIWVKDVTGSDGLAGATIFAIVAPMALAPIIGWVVDRFRRRPFFITLNLVTAAVLTPLFAVRDRGDVWIIFTVAAAYGMSYIALNAALSGLIKEIVPDAQLADANGALQTVKQGLRLLGPLLGAGIYTAVGGWMLAAVGMTGFCVAAGAGALLRLRETPPAPTRRHWAGEASAGVRHLLRTPVLRRGVLGMAMTLLVLGFSESVAFAYVDQGLGRSPAFIGVLVTAMGVGGLIGGLLSSGIVRRFGELTALATGVALLSPATLAMTYPQVVLGLLAMTVAGFGIPVTLVALNTLIQRGTPGPLLGRVAAAAEAVIGIPQTLSIGTGAVLVGLVPFQWLFLAMSAVTALAAGYLFTGRRLSPSPTPSTAAEEPVDPPAAVPAH
ncbi:MAG TPA: MFS transporter [Micromonosporaceae bacterium]